MPPLRLLTWHIHGSYLYYLAQSRHQFWLPVQPGRPEGYGGRIGHFNWPDNVHEVPAAAVKDLELDCILFQSERNYQQDQYEILTPAQRQLPRIYLEHNPPRQHPTDTRHPVTDPNILLVHVTAFNALMWDNGNTPTRVIEHGVLVPAEVHYTGELARGLVVVNGLHQRGRRLGADIFAQVRQQIPLDLVGMGATDLGGLGELPPDRLPSFMARYRFLLNPIRYTSLGLAVCEAMAIGMPIIALATTEMVTVVENGVSGYLSTDVQVLIKHMQDLLAHPEQAQRLSQGAYQTAQKRFQLHRFLRDWDEALALVTDSTPSLAHSPTPPPLGVSR